MKKIDVVQRIFQGHVPDQAKHEKGLAFAPTNIALCKYWGKRDSEINLPVTSSLSIALPDRGSLTNIAISRNKFDSVILNEAELPADSKFVQRLSEFLNLFRPAQNWFLDIDIKMNIPVAAGLASSAAGFASIIAALNDLFGWELSKTQLSILARLGSGSASRSFWNGFVEWHAGIQADGMDSFAEPLKFEWPSLLVGLLVLTKDEKSISSRQAMQRTIDSSILYGNWPKKVARDMVILRQALQVKNFSLLGGTSESNALTMHATMLSSWPPVCYFLPETIATMHKIWNLRAQGLELYFTQDAGPNLKLLFMEENKETVLKEFPELDVVQLFD